VLRTARFKTSEASEPRDTDPARAWDELLAARAELKQIIATGDGLALGAVSAPHPALGPFSGYDWIVFVGSHAARHADQIRESMAG
jgi:ABC-type sugar transport system substrate-binding protein